MMSKSKDRAAILLAACAMTSSCAVANDSSNAAVSPAGHFEFHIDPWISLHHFAYHFVREEEPDLKLRGDVPLSDGDRRAMSPEFRAACEPLKKAYRPYIEGSLLHDKNTRGLTKELWDGPDAVSDPAVRNALKNCMPIYRETHWPSHRAASQRFLEKLTAQLEMHEATMADALAESLEGSWPETAIRVDFTAYANWAGAYTDDLPPNITLSSFDETISAYAFEILFHESAHTGNLVKSLDAAADAALQATDLENDRYWHYMLFFVTGRTVSAVFGDPDYVPYSKAVGLTKQKSSSAFYEALEKSWDLVDTLHDRALIAARTVAQE
jgi:hypothetical protein